MSVVVIVVIVVVVIAAAAVVARTVKLRRLDARREDARDLRKQAQAREINAERHIAQAEEQQRFAREDARRAVEIDPDVDDDVLPDREPS
jgi:predicted Holliday junction resolvase-like endonuclease